MLNLNFPEKGLGLVSPPHFVYNFSRKMFLILYSTNTKYHCLIAFTSRDIGQYVYYNCLLTGCDVMKSIFLIKPFNYMTKKSRRKLKYLENEKRF